MCKIIIADDEELIRKGLKKTILNSKLSISSLEEASNGLDIISKINDFSPDIIITDVKMPVMDGLESIKKIKEITDKVFFIIISGYEDFNYARKALKMGVEDYILKPIDEEELINVIRRVINKKNARDSSHRGENWYIETNNIIKNIIYNKESVEFDKKVERLLTLYNLNYFFIAVISAYNLINYANNNFDITQLINIMKKNIDQTGYLSFIFENKPGEIICLCNTDTCQDNILKETLENTAVEIEAHTGLRVNMGLSCGIGELHNLRKAYNEASSAILLGLYNTDELVHRSIETDKYGSISKIDFDVYKSEIIDSIFTANRNNGIRNIKKMFREVLELRVNPIELISALQSIFIFICQLIQKENKLSIAIFDEYMDRLNFIHNYTNIKELEEFYLNIYLEIFNLFFSDGKGECRQIIQKAITYIKNNFFNDITLKTVAESVHLSPAYFSYLFKKETNINFIDYVFEIRMEKARELLINYSQMRIYEVAYKVGYNDVKYFNKIFKKKFSLTPGEYREKYYLYLPK